MCYIVCHSDIIVKVLANIFMRHFCLIYKSVFMKKIITDTTQTAFVSGLSYEEKIRMAETAEIHELRRLILQEPLHEPGRYAEAEIKLLERNCKNLIKDYICRHELFAEAQFRLIDLGDEELIRLYIKHHHFCYDARVQLTFRGDAYLIRLCIEKDPLHEYGRYADAEIKMIELRDYNLFREYADRYDLFDEAKARLYAPENEIMLKIYRIKHRFA